MCFWKNEKRKAKRSKLNLEITPIGHSKNLSPAGMFVATSKEYKVKDLIELCFYLPGSTEKISVVAEVNWISTSFSKPGIGVSFIRFISGSSKMIETYLDKQAKG